jgi:hypothetical protein
MPSLRETVPLILSGSASVLAAASPATLLPIYQAEAVVSETDFPFIVVRWLQKSPGMGDVKRHPFILFAYDNMGDYTRAEKLANAAAKEIKARFNVRTDTGYILAFEERVGDGQGEDLIDEGYNAAVVPYSLTAVASGL